MEISVNFDVEASFLSRSEKESVFSGLLFRLNAAKVVPDLYGLGDFPRGVGPDSDGVMIFEENDFWVVCNVSKGVKRMPSFFSCIYDAVRFFELKVLHD